MKITKRQLRNIINEAIRKEWVPGVGWGAKESGYEDAAPKRVRKLDPERSFRKMQKVAERIGADWASDNLHDEAAGIEGAARDLAASALWEVGDEVVAAAQEYLQRNARWDGITGEVDLLDMLKDSVASGAYSVSG